MRGKGYSSDRQTEQSRITPAYAGKRTFACIRHCRSEDHPRLCGEKPLSTGHPALHTGSPPPMRGKVSHAGRYALCAWITPAYAGKSLGACACTENIQDHPRLCGEKANPACLASFRFGSPPPMRGKGISNVCNHKPRGITPAYAGKSSICQRL